MNDFVLLAPEAIKWCIY